MAEERTPEGRADVSVVVLAGGGSTRFGSDKLAALLDGRPVLDHLLGALPGQWPVVLVGAPRPSVRPDATWTVEDPPGGGPLAAVAAGVAEVRTGVVVVAAGDMPRAAEVLPRLVAALDGAPRVSAAVAVDDDGRANPLLAAYRTAEVRAALAGEVDGRPARQLLRLSHVELRVVGESALDVDTQADLDGLRMTRRYLEASARAPGPDVLDDA